MKEAWGIDPGLSGGIVHISRDNILEIHDMPTLTINKKGKREVAAFLASDIIQTHPNSSVFIERVAARPGQGVSSMFNFGKNYGILMGIVAGRHMLMELVTPFQWKKDLKVGNGKDGSRYRAQELFPNYSEYFARKKDDGRAEAALIAYWGLLHSGIPT